MLGGPVSQRFSRFERFAEDELGCLAGDLFDQYAALLPIRERVLGPDHPRTLAARSNLAYWTGKTKDSTPDTS